jgi:hypothetical protein
MLILGLGGRAACAGKIGRELVCHPLKPCFRDEKAGRKMEIYPSPEVEAPAPAERNQGLILANGTSFCPDGDNNWQSQMIMKQLAHIPPTNLEKTQEYFITAENAESAEMRHTNA